jgi:anthranilate phosphoribosyltransferase
VMTTGAALVMDGRVASHSDGVRAAEKAIDSGAALAALETLIRVSNS